jgi:hypothetical protein
MIRQAVQSSNIKSVGYDPDTKRLEIEFISGGVYQYMDVPETVHSELIQAESKGSYFQANIRDRYVTKRI